MVHSLRNLFAMAILLGFLCTANSVGFAAEPILFRSRDDETCRKPLRVDNEGEERLKYPYECMTARYVLPEGNASTVSQRYDLSFLEYGGPANKLMDNRQWLALNRVLDGSRKKYVVVFVHGWHHNARVEDRDVRRMHTFLSYTRSFLNQRPAYRDTDLVGIYVGWSATAHGDRYRSAIDVLSYGRSKRVSERVSPAVMTDLLTISARLKLDQGNSRANKMLVLGHSFGGNMLATGLKNRIIDQLNAHHSGNVIAPPLGDLTVMINPASEARKFIDIQKKIRELEITFPVNQPPGYMAITSTTDWNDAELCQKTPNKTECNRSIEYDRATAEAFSYGQMLFNFRFLDQDKTTIGHFRPTDDFPYGATHDLTAIKGGGHVTNYRSGADPNKSVCRSGRPWLPLLRTKDPYWDTFDNEVMRPTIIDPRANYLTEYQLRAYLYRRESQKRFSARIGNEPYWNVRSLPNLIQGHNDFMSYIVMCMLNQFVLDDIGGMQTRRLGSAN